MRAEFVHIGNTYINVNSIAYLTKNVGGLVIFLRDSDRTFTVRSPYCAEVEEFLASHTVVDIQSAAPNMA
jgi:hypothetical protein